MIISITESQFNRIFEHKTVTCDNCGWEWKLSDGGNEPYKCHKCGHTSEEQDMDERSRSFAFTRKKRKFSQPERMANPLRYKEVDRIPKEEIDETSRSLALTRKIKIFDKTAVEYAHPRFSHHVKRLKGVVKTNLDENDVPISPDHIKWVEKFNEGGKVISCPNCRKKFIQTTHKKKKSLPICPTCGTHVQQDKKEGE
jgi:transcription initiation factor TFIIIB Brf1 subunit/transcription initiation factor TFIIB